MCLCNLFVASDSGIASALPNSVESLKIVIANCFILIYLLEILLLKSMLARETQVGIPNIWGKSRYIGNAEMD